MAINPGRPQESPLRNYTTSNNINSLTQAEEEHPLDIANTPQPSSPNLTINPADDLPFFGDLDYPSDLPTPPYQDETTLTSPEPSIALTPRQKKVLNYRVLRHMSNVRITKRPTLHDIKPDDLDDLNEYQQEHLQESLERQTAPSIPVPVIPISEPQIAPEPVEIQVSSLEPSSKSQTRNVETPLTRTRMPEKPTL